MAREGQPSRHFPANERSMSTYSSQNNGIVKFLFLLLVTVFFLSTAVDVADAGTLNLNKIVCKNRDRKPAIPVEQCKPAFTTKRTACEKLIRKCKCQHDIEMKWTATGCPGSRGEGGCQCADYCGYSCPGKCRGDPLKRCRYVGGQCSNIHNGATGPISQCPVPTAAPSASPSCFPGESIVITTTGPKRMDELEIGDYVQDIALQDDDEVKAGTVRFTQLIAWLHLGREKVAEFREIFVDDPLDDGRKMNQTVLRISDPHLLFVQDPFTLKPRNVTAKQVKVGHYVYLVGKGTSSSILGRVTKINTNVQKLGYYGPMTLSGTLVVDGVHVSSYILSGHNLINFLCAPLRLFAQYVGPIPEWYTSDGLHYYAKFLMWLSSFFPDHIHHLPQLSW